MRSIEEFVILICRSFSINMIMKNGMINFIDVNIFIYIYRFRELKKVKNLLNENWIKIEYWFRENEVNYRMLIKKKRSEL